jgi:hypothetical protein
VGEAPPLSAAALEALDGESDFVTEAIFWNAVRDSMSWARVLEPALELRDHAWPRAPLWGRWLLRGGVLERERRLGRMEPRVGYEGAFICILGATPLAPYPALIGAVEAWLVVAWNAPCMRLP